MMQEEGTSTFTERLAALQQALGAPLAEEYVRFLTTHCATHGSWYISAKPDYWGVSVVFELGDGDRDDQVDRVYALVGGALPPRTLPVADYLGDLYLLACAGANRGAVLYWNHESDSGDHSVEHVADSFGDFLALLVEEGEGI